MSETGKIIIAIFSSGIITFGGYKFLSGIFRYLIDRYMKGIDEKFGKLFDTRETVIGHDRDIENIKENITKLDLDILNIQTSCKESHAKWKN